MRCCAPFRTARPRCHATRAASSSRSSRPSPPPANPAPGFFTDDERAVLGKLCDHVFPPDDTPGASALGAVDYIEGLLTAFDVAPPRIFAGGPFSGRQPFIDSSTGTASANHPPDAFATWLPLSRFAEAGWRLRLLGSTGVTGGGPNDAALGAIAGWRNSFKTGIQSLITKASVPVAQIDDGVIGAQWRNLDGDFTDSLVQLTLEGCLGAPEYGGNKAMAGWRLAHFEGDSQPLGYSQFDQTAMLYRERAEAPCSTANPGADPEPISADIDAVLQVVVLSQHGRMQ